MTTTTTTTISNKEMINWTILIEKQKEMDQGGGQCSTNFYASLKPKKIKKLDSICHLWKWMMQHENEIVEQKLMDYLQKLLPEKKL